MTFGVKFSASEVDDAFAEMKIDEVMAYFILITISIIVIMTITMTSITIMTHILKQSPTFHVSGPNCWDWDCFLLQGMIDAAHLKGLMVSK